MAGQTFNAGSRPTGAQLTNIVYMNAANISVTAVTETTASASYVNIGAVSSFSFTKQLTATNVLICLSAGWVATGTTVAKFGVLINGTDTDITRSILGGGVEGHSSGQVIVTGLAAGTYTIQGRWKTSSGTAGRNAANHWYTLTACEVT